MLAWVNLHSEDGISPPSEFRSKFKRLKTNDNAPKELGIVLVKLFPCILISRAMIKEPKEGGMLPVSLFLLNAKKMTDVNLPKEAGIGPSKLLPFKLMVIIFVNFPILEGIRPCMQLLDI